MVLISETESLMSLAPRGTFGFTAAAGFARCGYSRCGASKLFGGIYRRQKTQTGWQNSRGRYMRPTNPQTETQQAWRAVFAAGWDGYNALTSDEKKLLSKQARNYRLSGPQLYMRRWLQQNR